MAKTTYIVCNIVGQGKDWLKVKNETVCYSWSQAMAIARRTGLRVIRETAKTVVVYDKAYHA